MDGMTKKLKFVVIVFIGMISLILIYDRMNYNNYIYHYINRSIHNSIVINSNSYDSNSDQGDIIDSAENIDFQLNSDYNTVNKTSSDYKNLVSNNKSNYFYDQYIEMKQKVHEFESKYLIPQKRRSSNSRLLYTDVVKDVLNMSIGANRRCDDNYGNGTKVVVIVISRVNGFSIRQTLRETWAQPKELEARDVKVYFALGLPGDGAVQDQIITENHKYNDILQWDFYDNYYNLTLKSIGILRWLSVNCFNARFVYKVDDDCIINTEKLVEFTETTADTKTIYGQLWRNPFVDRNRRSKFFISRSDFDLNKYPDYTGGPWLMSGQLVPGLYETALQSLPALPWEDVFITGVSASKLGVKRRHLTGLVYFQKSQFNQLNHCWFRENVIFWQNLDEMMIRNGWRNVVNTRDMVCLSKGSTIYPTSPI